MNLLGLALFLHYNKRNAIINIIRFKLGACCMKTTPLILLAYACLLSPMGYLAADINSDPWQMNVYTISGMGNSNSAYSGASIQGTVGSGGNVYLSSVGLNTSGPAATYALYANGNASFVSSSSYNGGLSVGGNLNYTSSATTGNVQSGGNLTGSSGNIQGNVTLQGTNQAGGGLVISGTVAQNQPFTNPLNASAVNSYFQNASSFWGGLSSTATWSNVYGQIVVSNLQAGRNIVSLSLANINSAWGIQLSGPSNAFVVFNITDLSGTLETVTYNFSGGMGLSNVLFNLTNSTSLSMSGGTYASVLAPLSTVTFGSGMLQGNFVSNNLLGNGSFQQGSFSGFAADQANFAVAVPEPHTYLLLGSMLAGVLYFNKRRVGVRTS
jgi:choice-of-anchor A domain-containing protein